MERVREGGDDAEVAAAAAQRPEEVLVRSALAVTKEPSASTTSALNRLSIVSPCLRVRWPRPPPRVSPPTPVVEMIPAGVARPKAWRRGPGRPAAAPPSDPRGARLESTRTPRMGARSITSPSSTSPSPGPLWPPPRTAMLEPVLAAEVDRAHHVGHVAQRAISAGTPVDHPVVEATSVVVAGVAGLDQLPRSGVASSCWTSSGRSFTAWAIAISSLVGAGRPYVTGCLGASAAHRCDRSGPCSQESAPCCSTSTACSTSTRSRSRARGTRSGDFATTASRFAS